MIVFLDASAVIDAVEAEALWAEAVKRQIRELAEMLRGVASGSAVGGAHACCQPAWSPHLRSRARLRKALKRHFVDPSLALAAVGASPERLLGALGP